ncbi:MAG: elongation factor Ts [Bacteroidales bacterium]|nr:elongation factor Ts [Bacteroidales bacterium]MBN2817816.1 elongation factor Ts [Bacteroidales bacterium]
MAQITAAEVSKLRKTTGAGMMDCKIALQEAEGNFDKAIEIIRKKGQAVANKRADREASEGVSLAKATADGKFGAIIALNCETDFVAKNEDFIKFGYSILDKALEAKPADLEALKAETINGKVIADLVVEQIGIIGEKIELAYYDKVEAEQVIPYIHHGNKLSTIVGLNKVVDIEVGKDVAMQIAAMSPIAVDENGVSEEVKAKELEIGREQALKEGKPENIVDKIALGKLSKFYKENTLLNQDFTKDSKKTVRQYLQETDKELTTTAFLRYSLNV